MKGVSLKRIFVKGIKIALAGAIAFILLNVIFYFYYYLPTRIITPQGATDFVLTPNYSGYVGDEGYAHFTTDKNGYNNPGFTADSVDYLVMGSSHTLAYNVAYNEGLAYLLNERLEESDQQSVYNISMWSHMLLNCFNNITYAKEQFKPTKGIIIETASVSFQEKELEQYLSGNLPEINSNSSEMVNQLKKLSFIQIAMHNLKSMAGNNVAKEKDVVEVMKEIDNSTDIEEYKLLLNKCFQKASGELDSSSTKLIIMYHPTMYLDESGKVQNKTEQAKLEIFRACCEENNIDFVDLTESFTKLYETEHRLPHGFSNTTFGEGHINKYGHKVIAEAIYDNLKENY